MSDALSSIADGAWIASAPVSIVGMPLTSTMTVLRLGDGRLLVHSPIAITTELRAAVGALGVVAHLYAPNTFHHLALGDWAAAFPSARVHAPAALAKKRPDLRIDRAHDVDREAPIDDALHEVHVDGFRLEETVLLHRASRTLAVADLVHNIGRPAHGWTLVYASAMGFYGEIAMSRLIRWAAFPDRAAARRSVDRVLAEDFDRVVVGHGAPLLESAHEALEDACTWLPPARP